MSDLPTNPENTRPTDPAPADVATIDARRPALAKLADAGWVSDAGTIVNLLHGGFTGTVSVLESKAGSTRAKHWHRADDHFLFILSGQVEYWERAIGSTELPECQHFYAGEMFYTPSEREHALRFPVDTKMVSISSLSRTHDEHESDVVRVEFKLPGE